MQLWSLGQEDPLEQGMVAHFSILAWRIPVDRGAWRAAVHRVAHSRTQLKCLSAHAHSNYNLSHPGIGISWLPFPWRVIYIPWYFVFLVILDFILDLLSVLLWSSGKCTYFVLEAVSSASDCKYCLPFCVRWFKSKLNSLGPHSSVLVQPCICMVRRVVLSPHFLVCLGSVCSLLPLVEIARVLLGV